MNRVGVYFFSFLICGHLLKMSIKTAATVDRCDFVNEEQSLSAQSLADPAGGVIFFFTMEVLNLITG